MENNLVVTSERVNKKKEKAWIRYIHMRIQNNKNFLGFIGGPTGCITGDSIINVNRNSLGRQFRIDHMYKQYHQRVHNKKSKSWNLDIPTYVRSYDGKSIRLHKLKDVVYSGKKEVWELGLENGKTIKATADHKIMTKEGWVEMQNLSENDEVMCDTLRPQKGKQRSFKLRDTMIKVVYHPYPSRVKPTSIEVEVHRLIYEAHLNNLHFKEYLDIIWNDEEKAKTLDYINPKLLCVHHKDGNHYNNSIENLELIERSNHSLLHAKQDEAFRNFNQGIPVYSKVLSRVKLGIQKTYDIVCEEPYRNFVANGIVIHNSGKSWCSLRIAEELDPSFTMERCIFSGVELMKLINSGTLRKGSVIIFEEAGVGMSNRNWQSATNKMLNYLVQTFRHKNFILIMNSPYMDFVDAATRKLFHAEMITQGINKKTKEVMLKPQLIQYNARMQKFYYHRLKQSNEDGIAPIQFWNVGKPSSELLKEYEEKKTEYTTKLNQEIMAELEKAQNKEEAKTYSQTCKDCYHEWESRKEHPARCPACGTYRKKANKERNKANKGTLPMPDH